MLEDDAELAPFATGGAWSWSSKLYEEAQKRKPRQTGRRKKAEDDDGGGGGAAPQAAVSMFRLRYENGELPIRLDQGHGKTPSKRQVAWLVHILDLDLNYYMPIFLDGLRELEQPYSLLATEALKQLVAVAGPAHRMLTLLEMLVIPLQKLLRDDDPRIVERALDLVALLTTCDAVERGGMGLCGRALVPKFQKLCPTLNALRESMPQFEQKVMQTLELMELHGGEEACKKIKSLIPTYQSAVEGVSVSKTFWSVKAA